MITTFSKFSTKNQDGCQFNRYLIKKKNNYNYYQKQSFIFGKVYNLMCLIVWTIDLTDSGLITLDAHRLSQLQATAWLQLRLHVVFLKDL